MNSTVFVTFEQLVIANPNRSSGDTTLITIVRVVPVQSFSIERLAFERRQQINTIDFVLHFDLGRIHDRRKQIDRRNRFRTNAPCLGNAWISNDPRLANTTFVDPAFATTQWKIAGRRTFACRQPTIIRSENDDRIISQP